MFMQTYRGFMSEPLTVTQFNERVNAIVNTSDPIRNVTMTGEISALSRSPAGHIYPTLKDNDSVVRCTLFRYAASRLKFKPEVGMKVTVFGSASYYVKGGSFGFNIESMVPYGKGELQAALEKLTNKLLNEGLFDVERKKNIPRYPRVIGVVTSPTGAVIKDIIDTTARRFPVDILLAPAIVQGDDAPASIVAGITELNKQDVDVIIVGRGGGSAEDLSAFNSEDVVRAIASSRVPIISAVGHATDKSLSDRVADRYAETPTAAAVIATPDRIEELKNISGLEDRMCNSLKGIIRDMRSRFDRLDSKLSPKSAKTMVDGYDMRFRQLCFRSDAALKAELSSYAGRYNTVSGKLNLRQIKDRIFQYTMSVDNCSQTMDLLMKKRIGDDRSTLTTLSKTLRSLDPNNVLERGYSFVSTDGGKVLTSVDGLKIGENVRITMRDGTAMAEVKELNSNDR
jgi:exodeoxyribonuclease VII large subunit